MTSGKCVECGFIGELTYDNGMGYKFCSIHCATGEALRVGKKTIEDLNAASESLSVPVPDFTHTIYDARMWLAGMAMQGMLANPAVHATVERTTKISVLYADALLAELKKPNPEPREE